MKSVTRFQTSDGQLHETHIRANNHAEDRYGNLLTKLAAQIVRLEKYTEAIAWLEANIGQLQLLQLLREDRVLEPNEHDD